MLASILFAIVMTPSAQATCEGELYWSPVQVAEVEDIDIVGYRLRATRLVGGQVEARLGLVARSRRDTAWSRVEASVVGVWPGLVDHQVSFPLMPPGVEVESVDDIVVRVPRRWANRVRRWVETVGFEWSISGAEHLTWAPHERFLDAETDAAWSRLSTMPDGSFVLWFDGWTDLLLSLTPGDALMPAPDIEWPGAPEPYIPVGLAASMPCAPEFPLITEGVVTGDGLNGGSPGEVGVLIEPLRHGAFGPWTGRTGGGVRSEIAPPTAGPWDSFLSVNVEMSQDVRYCPPGADPLDTDNDGTIDDCEFTVERSTLTYAPLAGVVVTGTAAWRHLDAVTEMVIRARELDSANMYITTVSVTSQTVRGADVSPFGPSYGALIERVKPQGTIALGPLALSLDLFARFDAGASGGFDGSMAVAGTFTDTYIWDVRWTARDGFTAEGYHSRDEISHAHPTLSSDADGRLSGTIALESAIRFTEARSQLSLEVTLRGESALATEVDHAASPWWSTYGTSEATVGAVLAVRDVPFATADTIARITETELVDADAGTPPGAYGLDLRWARFLDLDVGQNSDVLPTGLAVSPSGELTVVGNEYFGNVIARLDPDGDVLWGKVVNRAVHAVAALDDGSVIVAAPDCRSMMRVGADGAVLWGRAYSIPHTVVQSCQLTPVPAAGGGQDIISTATLAFGPPYSRPMAMRLDDDGAVLWARSYDLGGSAELRVAGVTLDGGVVVAGLTSLTADGVPGSPAPNGLVMRLSPDGDAVWANVMRSGGLEDAAELPNGTVFATGGSAPYYYSARHGLQVVAIDGSGQLAWSQTYAEDVLRAGRVDDPHLRAPGDSSWDRGVQIEPAGDGGVLVLGSTGIGESTATWTLRLDAHGEPVDLWMQDLPGPQTATELVVHNGASCWAGETTLHDPAADPERVWVGCMPMGSGLTYPATSGVTSLPVLPEVNDWFDWQVFTFVLPGGISPMVSGSELVVTPTPTAWVLTDQGMAAEMVAD